MAITRLGGANAISGTLPAANINNTSISSVTSLPAAITTGSWVKISSTTCSATSAVEFDNLASTYNVYVIVGSQIRPTTNAQEMEINFGTDGSTYSVNKTSAYGYQYNNEADNDSEGGGLSGANSLGGNSGDQPITQRSSNHGTYGKSGWFLGYFVGLGQGGNYATYDMHSVNWTDQNRSWNAHITGHVQAAADCIQIKFDSGTIAAGTFTLYGVDQS